MLTYLLSERSNLPVAGSVRKASVLKVMGNWRRNGRNRKTAAQDYCLLPGFFGLAGGRFKIVSRRNAKPRIWLCGVSGYSSGNNRDYRKMTSTDNSMPVALSLAMPSTKVDTCKSGVMMWMVLKLGISTQ